MPDKVITSIDQVTNAWLTSVLTKSGALINGAVAVFDVKAGQGNWSPNVTLEYGLALAEGLAVMHARWWGARQFREVGATMPSAGHIRRFVDISESVVENIINHFSLELEPYWPDTIRTLYARHPQTIIKRTSDDRGLTLVHGDVGHKNVLVPRAGDRPIYMIDRQPFDWALTTWLGVYDLAYAMVLDWEIETRRHLEIPILRNYLDRLIKHGVNGYSWEQLYDDYKLCVAMGVYVATEYFRGGVKSPWVSTWLLMLRRALTACEDLHCSELW
jgi:hypothetical protein